MTPAHSAARASKDWPPFVFPVLFSFGVPLGLLYLFVLADLFFPFLPHARPVAADFWPSNTDFLNYWSAARLALDHQIATLFNQEAFYQAQKAMIGHMPVYNNNWSYPPHLLLLIIWFGFLPYSVAFGLWTVLTFSLYAFAIAYRRDQPWKLTAVLALAPASFINVLYGQNGFLTAACLVGGLRLIDKRPVLAGALFGLLTFKPQFMLLLPFVILFEKRWRVLASATATSALFIGLSFLLFGTEPWVAYFRETLPYQTALFEASPAADKNIMNSSFITLFAAVRRWGGDLPLAYGASFFSALIAVAATIYACRRSAPSELRTMIVLTAVFLTSPYAHNYDMTLLSGAIVSYFAVSQRPPLTLPKIVLIVALCLAPLYCTGLNLAGVAVCPFLILGFLALGLQAINNPKQTLLSRKY